MVSTIKKRNLNKRHSKLKRRVYKYQHGGVDVGADANTGPDADGVAEPKTIYSKIKTSLQDNLNKMYDKINKKNVFNDDKTKIKLLLLIYIRHHYTEIHKKICSKKKNQQIGGAGALAYGVFIILGSLDFYVDARINYSSSKSKPPKQVKNLILEKIDKSILEEYDKIIADFLNTNNYLSEQGMKEIFDLTNFNNSCDSITNLTIRAVLRHQIQDNARVFESKPDDNDTSNNST